MMLFLLISLVSCCSVSANRFISPPMPMVRANSQEPAQLSGPVRLMGEFVIEDKPGETVPSFTLYFEGNVLRSNEAGNYTITVSADDVAKGLLDDLSLVICKRIDLDFEKGHVLAGIKMKKLEKCSWYKLDREWDPEEKKFFWVITQQPIGESDNIPEKALVVFMSNKHVVDVCDTIHMASSSSDHGLLPTIVLQDCDHSRNSVKSTIEALEIHQHTAHQRSEKLITPNGVECTRFVW